MSAYYGKTVSTLVGSSAKFTWTFFGDGVYAIQFRNKNGTILSLDRQGNPLPQESASSYANRVSGNLNRIGNVFAFGDLFSGQATFIIDNITKDDEKLYSCKLKIRYSYYRRAEIRDLVYLSVEGGQNKLNSYNTTHCLVLILFFSKMSERLGSVIAMITTNMCLHIFLEYKDHGTIA